MKPTRIQFMDYVAIRNSGVTNMFDVKRVCELSSTELMRDHCMYIMDHFLDLAEEYGVEV